MTPLHPSFAEFWRAEEKRLLALVTKLDAESVEALVARKFYLTAKANAALLAEMTAALSWGNWDFYKRRPDHIARSFNPFHT